MENILERITKIRLAKGFTYENMANDLGISIAAYRKIELKQTNLTVDRLYQIAAALNVQVATLLDIDNDNFHQENKDNSTGYLQKIENFYQENKESFEKIIIAKDELISSLKDQILIYKNK